MGEHRRPAHDQPHDKRQQRNAHHHGNKDGTDFIDDALHRSLAALRFLHATDDLRQYSCLAYIRRFHLEGTRLVDGACQDAVADLLLDRKRFAGQHTLVHGRNALRDNAIHRNLFARTDNHDIADTEESDWDIFFEAVLQLVGGLGLQVHQAADGRRGALLGTSLQEFAQQDKGDNHARSLVINMRLQATLQPEVRADGIKYAKEERDKRTERHQRIHIRAPLDGMTPTIHVERAAKAEHHDQSHAHQQPIHIRHIEMHHAEDRKGNRDDPCPDGIVAHPEISLALLLHLDSDRVFLLYHQIIPAVADGLLHRLDRKVLRVESYGQKIRRQVHIRLLDARQATDNLLDIAGTYGTRHI